MRTQVTFRSGKFPPYEGEEAQINPGVWGKRLAEYVVERLEGRGFATDGIIAEDWGWYDATPEPSRLVAALRDILDADPEISDVAWTEPG